MSRNVFDVLKERGFIAQTTNEDKIREILGSQQVTFYIGFDPTADSLHVGHLLQLIVMSHMQKAGHRPIAVLGGGTAMVGDPSGRTDMRQMLTKEQIDYNASRFKVQMEKLIDFSDGKAIMVNNGDWLLGLNYVEFLREIGVHFSVNRMLAAECFKSRLERGLSFIEFNYMLMQSYDFLRLYQDYNCILELGGDDQWSNILAGIDLIRRVKGEEAYGMTFCLLTTSEGKKMGKTQKGAVWLDPEKTSPYDFYQYWRNVNDADVIRFLKLLTFLPMEEIERLAQYRDEKINEAKEILAYEVTKIVHGEEEARKAQQAARALFADGGDLSSAPTTEISGDDLKDGIGILDLLMKAGLIPSKGEGRRLISQGGIYINGERVDDQNRIITSDDFKEGQLFIRKGKKMYHRVVISN
ncbi:tyrosine--tRNA ligase TyrS [Thermoclostridium stercorarium subsp. stercorarium DSM 8532]|uniref:Tyrosine--tRNA ligase n=1 Tax=Thermoclostridium stercorarium (strain ATCC 35414 / DSM 8532 / NCIMB 11754) TaxID=1121335 RepID=L7VLL2_THES1|nr:tyrosine--tRNA ligase [Thermoclostridium stercorarium]AGC69080.1 tyrosine--tRNA ligase TyrS [Thermoclostridium stercorarium subsp. stercorarium DSM 8532]AGI40053.1 tyrosyl-tRNA synthetase [Thermoclostridium stercorarium subsp. stercorarium DSM 8532]UZQ85041.1 tyrosine--tRNA ligase [Thermoclostridium stercorarium]